MKPYRFPAFLLAVLLLLTACSGDSSSGDSNPTPTDSDQPIFLGALVPLSTPGAVVAGEAMRDAMSIAVDELNQRGGLLGRTVELIVADSKGTPAQGRQAVEELIEQDNVVALAGGFHSSVAVEVKDTAHAHGIPIVFTDTWADVITSDMQPEVFRVGPLNSEVSAIDVAFIASLPGIDKVAIVTEDSEYGIPAAQETTDGLAQHGIDATTYTIDLGSEDFGGLIDALLADEPDMLVVYPTGEAGYRVEQQAAGAGLGPGDLPVLCNPVSLESEAFWANVPDGNYCFLRRVGVPEPLYSDVARDFVGRYTELTGKQTAESYALTAYDSIMVLAQAIADAGSTRPEAIIEALENVDYDGASGRISFPYNTSNPPAATGAADKWWHQFTDPAITIAQYQEPGQNSAGAPVVFPETYRTGDAIVVGR